MNIWDELVDEFIFPNPRKLLSVFTWGVVPKKLNPVFWGWGRTWGCVWDCCPVCIVILNPPPLFNKFIPWFWAGWGVFPYKFNPENPDNKLLLLFCCGLPYKFNEPRSPISCFGWICWTGFTEGASFEKISSNKLGSDFFVSATGGLIPVWACWVCWTGVLPKSNPKMLSLFGAGWVLEGTLSSSSNILNGYFVGARVGSAALGCC